jgi:heme-degrading monooxygenase HmoA
MFTRVVKMTCKPGQCQQACKNINEKVMPILRKQQGFLDEIVLVSNTDQNQMLGLSFWNSRVDAERFHREQFQNIRDTVMQDVLATAPEVQTYDVDISTTHHIMAGKAA